MGSAEVFAQRLREMARARRAEDILFAPSEEPVPGESASPRSHVSDCYELAYVVVGEAVVETRLHSFDLNPERLLVIAPRVAHEDRPRDGGAGHVMFWCAVDENWARLDETRCTPQGGRRMGGSRELFGRTNVGSVARAMAAELEHREVGWCECAHGLLSYLSFILIRRLMRGKVKDLQPQESPAIEGDPRACRVIQRALEYCESNYWERVGLRDVAAEVGYSPAYVSRLFASHVGRSVSEHLRGLRMKAAKSMLERSEAPISEIARWLGYRDPANFTHAFTRASGVSPKAYRERLQGL